MMDAEPFDADEILGRLTAAETHQIFAGMYRSISLIGEDQAAQSIMICSANRREGATTVALGLALAAAQQTQPVLLIDGNVHTPRVCEAFGLSESTGLVDLMAGRVNPNEAVRQTRVANLWVIGAGVADPGQIKRLAPPKLRALLENLTREYALVILDGPALNVYPESVLYASQVDRVCLVVHSGVTRVPVVKAALSRLPSGRATKVEIILNRRVFNIPAWIYKRL